MGSPSSLSHPTLSWNGSLWGGAGCPSIQGPSWALPARPWMRLLEHFLAFSFFYFSFLFWYFVAFKYSSLDSEERWELVHDQMGLNGKGHQQTLGPMWGS